MSRELGSAFELPDDERNAAQASAELFGVKEVFGKARPNRVKPLALGDVYPDPYQPRRAMPSVIRRLWDGTSATLPDVLGQWIRAADDERTARDHRATPIDVMAWIGGNVDEAENPDAESPRRGPIETALMTVIDLATSIHRDGLTNPITVSEADNVKGYRIETGERRWMAYHLLNALYPEDGYERIPSRIMEAFSVWRQATENSARADLNAIERARQFALLMMDLWSEDSKSAKQFAPLDRFHHEQAFYAQVADESPPYGTGALLLSAMGVTHKSAITRYRALLRLPSDIWELADDLDWGLSDLYKMTMLDEDEARRMACTLARRDGQKVAWCNLLEESDTKPSPIAPLNLFREKQLPTLEKTLRKMSGKERRQAILYLQELLKKLDVE